MILTNLHGILWFFFCLFQYLKKEFICLTHWHSCRVWEHVFRQQTAVQNKMGLLWINHTKVHKTTIRLKIQNTSFTFSMWGSSHISLTFCFFFPNRIEHIHKNRLMELSRKSPKSNTLHTRVSLYRESLINSNAEYRCVEPLPPMWHVELLDNGLVSNETGEENPEELVVPTLWGANL